MIGLTWPRYNWTVFDVSGQFGVILDSFLCLLSVFPVVFLSCLCAFLGHFCVCGALFFEDKFCAALAEPQCCSKFFFKNTGPSKFAHKSRKDILWMPHSPTNLLPTPSSDPSQKASEASLFSRWWDEQSSKTYVPMRGMGWISFESRHQLTSSYQQSRAAPPRSRHCATFLAMPPTSFSGAG